MCNYSNILSHAKLPKDGKVLSHLGFNSKVIPMPLTVLSVNVGFCTSSPQQGVKLKKIKITKLTFDTLLRG
jgi:hypothetical protein